MPCIKLLKKELKINWQEERSEEEQQKQLRYCKNYTLKYQDKYKYICPKSN